MVVESPLGYTRLFENSIEIGRIEARSMKFSKARLQETLPGDRWITLFDDLLQKARQFQLTDNIPTSGYVIEIEQTNQWGSFSPCLD